MCIQMDLGQSRSSISRCYIIIISKSSNSKHLFCSVVFFSSTPKVVLLLIGFLTLTFIIGKNRIIII